MAKGFTLLLAAGLIAAAAGNAHAQQSRVFPPSNESSCPEGSTLTWAGSGTDVACRGLSSTCLAIMQGAYGSAATYNFYPVLEQRNVGGTQKWVPSGNWDCKLLSAVPPGP